MPDLPEETHSLGPFLFPRYYRLRIPMKNPSRAFYFVATLCLVLALGGIFLAGYYSGRNHSLAKLGQGLCFGGALSLIFATAVYKKQKGKPDSPR
jgi:drug/metabolite transporter (DMT)-like permease